MTENEKQIKQLILKYARHEPLTGDEMAILKEWRGRSPEHNALPDKVRDEDWVQEKLIRLSRVPSAEIWKGISEQLDKENGLTLPWYKNVAKNATVLKIAKVAGAAAAFALIVVAIGALFQNHPLKEKNAAIARVVPVADRVISTGDGKLPASPVLLPDGSQVWLNNSSKLSYSAAFARGERVVRLDGEGYFIVKKDLERPFSVVTADGVTRDLSTEFNIRAYPDEHEEKVTVLEGGIRVSNGKDSFELKKSLQQVLLSRQGINPPVLLGRADDAIAWRSGHFHFDGTDLKTALGELAHRYHKTVVYTDDVQGARIHMHLSRDLPLDQLLARVGYVERAYISLRVEGNEVIVSAVRAGKVQTGK